MKSSYYLNTFDADQYVTTYYLSVLNRISILTYCTDCTAIPGLRRIVTKDVMTPVTAINTSRGDLL